MADPLHVNVQARLNQCSISEPARADQGFTVYHHSVNAARLHAHAPGILLGQTEPVIPRCYFLLLILASSGLLAQDPPPVRHFEPYKGERASTPIDTPETSALPAGRVVYHTDPPVEKLMQQYKEHDHSLSGFRVQIFLGERKAAEDTKRAFLQKNPDIPAYQSWLAPNWRLRVGDCRTRLEAERLLRDLRTVYPGSYIVPDEIEMPLLPK